MKILSFYRPVVISTEMIDGLSRMPFRMAVNPGERVVVNDEMASQILTGRTSRGDWKCPKCTLLNHGSELCEACGEPLPNKPAVPIESVSDFMEFYVDVSRMRRPAKFRGRRILFYRNGGIGDQLIASCLSRFFSVELKAHCYQLADPQHQPLWCWNEFIHGQPVRFPMSIDSLIRRSGPFYDWIFPMESVSQYDNDQEQGNVYDRLFAIAGFDPDEIPAEYKRPYWAITKRDLEETREFYVEPYIAFQFRATNFGRTLPLPVIDLVLSRLNQIGLAIIVMDDRPLEPDLKKVVENYKNVKDVTGRLKNVRHFGAVVSMARLVVGPDSAAIHFAGCIDVPCISLFSTFSPESRVRDYKNHVAIWPAEKCNHAPCFNFMEELPYHKCPDGEQQRYCAVFEGVTGDKINEGLEKLGITK